MTHDVFSYGSNSLAQLRARVENPTLQSTAASLKDMARVFCLRSRGWGGGGVASIAPQVGTVVYGALVTLTDAELERLRGYEGGYREVQCVATRRDERTTCSCIVFIAGKPANGLTFTPSMSVPPHEAYLCAIHVQLREHYDMRTETITVRTCEGRDVRVVSDWVHPGVAQLSLSALVVEMNATGSCGWIMPATIAEVVDKLVAIGCDAAGPAAQLLRPEIGGADLHYLNENLRRAGRKTFGAAALTALTSMLCGTHRAHVDALHGGGGESELVNAIFAYGTLRSDFSATGDKWGVCAALAELGYPVSPAAASRATVKGFTLHQRRELTYPFAVRAAAAGAGATIVGTLLRWSDSGAFAEALRRCDSIEGFDPASPTGGLYRRDVVTATLSLDPSTSVRAYIYYQAVPREELERCRGFPAGDWLAATQST